MRDTTFGFTFHFNTSWTLQIIKAKYLNSLNILKDLYLILALAVITYFSSNSKVTGFNSIYRSTTSSWSHAHQLHSQPIRRGRYTPPLQFHFLSLTVNLQTSTVQFPQLPIFFLSLSPQKSLLLSLESHLCRHLRIKLSLPIYSLVPSPVDIPSTRHSLRPSCLRVLILFNRSNFKSIWPYLSIFYYFIKNLSLEPLE